MEGDLKRIRELETLILSVVSRRELTVPEPNEVVKCVLSGDYAKVFQYPLVKDLLQRNGTSIPLLKNSVAENVKRIITQTDKQTTAECELEILCVAIACLQFFVCQNWLGPLSCFSEDLINIISDSNNVDQCRKEICQEMMCDGEEVYSLCQGIEFLFVAQCVLAGCQTHTHSLQTVEWWILRSVYVYQQILEDKCASLREQVHALIDTVSKKEPLMTDDRNRDLLTQFHIEAGYIGHTFFDYKLAHEHLLAAKKCTGLQINLTGAMGKRTRFQTEDKAQLVLEVRRGEGGTKQESTVKTKLPKILNLDDDTVLEAINLTEPGTEFAVDMSPVEQAVVIATMEDHLRTHASQERLTEEEAAAHIETKCWSVTLACLYRRSCLEKGSCRRVERSMMQIEELMNQMKTNDPPASDRLFLFFSVKLPPFWKLERQLAELLLSIGAIGGALEVFERLQLWEDVITCYKRLGKMEKAETLIRDQLAIQETPNLWCFLGDVTRDVNHYIKAWEMSGHKHTRSQRCMGYLYMAQEEYEKCIECFQKSLSINSLQVPVWFTLGCACMAAKKFEEAVRAFKRCVNIDTDNFEAWNNMASAYVQLKDKKKALLTLKESIKCNYENWRVWENLLVVATDCGEFEEAIRAYHRLIDLKEKWTDVEVLAVLVKGVTGEYRDPQGNPTSQYKTRLLELFGRITAKVPSNGEIWRLYSELTNSLENQTPETQQKVLQYLQKSQRCLTQEVNWEKSLDKCKHIGEQSLELADLYLGFSSGSTEESLPLLQSAKMMLKNVQAKIKLAHTDPISDSIPSEDLRELVNKMEDKLQTIIARVKELKQ
ncbi:tetratricopeptide repeat protein 27-like isoform X2 [Saccostrea echinata]|uniref:tetratricopeptide repeat protein 27-like isoform X2 n=1 Tax=Saccostrea echinata TaxID=191078 RepID=UPI002A832198|nr:tetratricopeptide repeat protein 27-like isoform X2 [Saccostrea echinata]